MYAVYSLAKVSWDKGKRAYLEEVSAYSNCTNILRTAIIMGSVYIVDLSLSTREEECNDVAVLSGVIHFYSTDPWKWVPFGLVGSDKFTM